MAPKKPPTTAAAAERMKKAGLRVAVTAPPKKKRAGQPQNSRPASPGMMLQSTSGPAVGSASTPAHRSADTPARAAYVMPLLDQAKLVAIEAVGLDNTGKTAEALSKYKVALAQIDRQLRKNASASSKKRPSEQEEAELKSFAKAYIQRIRELEAEIASAAVAAGTPSNAEAGSGADSAYTTPASDPAAPTLPSGAVPAQQLLVQPPSAFDYWTERFGLDEHELGDLLEAFSWYARGSRSIGLYELREALQDLWQTPISVAQAASAIERATGGASERMRLAEFLECATRGYPATPAAEWSHIVRGGGGGGGSGRADAGSASDGGAGFNASSADRSGDGGDGIDGGNPGDGSSTGAGASAGASSSATVAAAQSQPPASQSLTGSTAVTMVTCGVQTSPRAPISLPPRVGNQAAMGQTAGEGMDVPSSFSFDAGFERGRAWARLAASDSWSPSASEMSGELEPRPPEHITMKDVRSALQMGQPPPQWEARLAHGAAPAPPPQGLQWTGGAPAAEEQHRHQRLAVTVARPGRGGEVVPWTRACRDDCLLCGAGLFCSARKRQPPPLTGTGGGATEGGVLALV